MPKIPSMRVIDLARAIAPGCKHKIVGIRPGEKLHEVLIPRDEMCRTLQYPSMYVIYPDDEAIQANRARGRRVTGSAAGDYASDTNKEWLTPVDLKRLLKT